MCVPCVASHLSDPSITMSPEPAQQTNPASKKKNNNKKKKNAAKKAAAAAAEEDARSADVNHQDGVEKGEDDDGNQSEVPDSPITVLAWKCTSFVRERAIIDSFS